jgi:hypothetical protein
MLSSFPIKSLRKHWLLFAASCLCFGTILLQLSIDLVNHQSEILTELIQYISYFTILTNAMVGIYFLVCALFSKTKLGVFMHKASTTTAIAVYITVVGLIFNLVLRSIYHPVGLACIANEIMHVAIPAGFFLYWLVQTPKVNLKIQDTYYWLQYPSFYLIYILVRGFFTNKYPYPFVNVAQIGLQKVLVNSFFLASLFFVLSVVFIWIGKRTDAYFIKYR